MIKSVSDAYIAVSRVFGGAFWFASPLLVVPQNEEIKFKKTKKHLASDFRVEGSIILYVGYQVGSV